MLKSFTLPDGTRLNKLGCGTWNMGDDAARANEEIEALRCGIDHGLNVVDTAEMYGDGRSESLVGKAIEGRREKVFLTSKFVPSHARPAQMKKSCEASLRRLNTDYLDLYLLHWPSATPLNEIVGGLEDLQTQGLIRHWGVSNFDTSAMKNLVDTPNGRQAITDQVLFNLERREAQYSLVGYLQDQQMFMTAYSPLGQGGRMLRNPALEAVAGRHTLPDGQKATGAQIALAWVLHQPNILAIPKAGKIAHMKANIDAQYIQLTAEDLQVIDAAFPPPSREERLHVI